MSLYTDTNPYDRPIEIWVGSLINRDINIFEFVDIWQHKLLGNYAFHRDMENGFYKEDYPNDLEEIKAELEDSTEAYSVIMASSVFSNSIELCCGMINRTDFIDSCNELSQLSLEDLIKTTLYTPLLKEVLRYVEGFENLMEKGDVKNLDLDNDLIDDWEKNEKRIMNLLYGEDYEECPALSPKFYFSKFANYFVVKS